MAAYATIDDVRSVVARDPFRSNSTADLGDDQFEEAISNAQAQVDGYLRKRYTTPFLDPVPALVVSLTIDIAAYLAGLNWYQETELLVSDPLNLRYLRAMALLKDISLGDIDLDAGDDGAAAPEPAGGLGAPINPNAGTMFGMYDFGIGSRFWPDGFDPYAPC